MILSDPVNGPVCDSATVAANIRSLEAWEREERRNRGVARKPRNPAVSIQAIPVRGKRVRSKTIEKGINGHRR